MSRFLAVAAIAVLVPWARAAVAQVRSDSQHHDGCVFPVDAAGAVRCALSRSPELRQARAEIDALAGRRLAAGVWLPSNPVVAAMGSRRRKIESAPSGTMTAGNWNLALSQEIEIGGQRAARLDVVDAEAAARLRRVAVAEQEVAATALGAYYEAVGAAEGVRVAAELAETTAALATAAEGRAKEGLLSGVDADVARAEATRLGLVRFEAVRRQATADASLALLLGGDAQSVLLRAEWDLPFAAGDILDGKRAEESALRLRGEITAAQMERQVLERQLVLIRRERVPNPVLSAFIGREDLNDRVFGLGLSIPVPLPGPVGRSREGEIAEIIARIRASESSLELVRRRVRMDVVRAVANAQARAAAGLLFTPEFLTRARVDLTALREGVASRQLSLREALVSQRSLIELVQSDIEVRLGRVLAIVELRRAAGLPLFRTGSSQ